MLSAGESGGALLLGRRPCAGGCFVAFLLEAVLGRRRGEGVVGVVFALVFALAFVVTTLEADFFFFFVDVVDFFVFGVVFLGVEALPAVLRQRGGLGDVVEDPSRAAAAAAAAPG